MIQDHCKEQIIRDGVREECGRVLRTDGGCENFDRHVAVTIPGSPVTAERE